MAKNTKNEIDQDKKINENKGLIAISKTLARAKDGMNMQEKKFAYIFLSKFEWKNPNADLEIWVDKPEIARLLGSELDSTDLSWYLRKLAKSTAHHSELTFDGKDKDEWEDIPLFGKRRSTRNRMMMKINEDAAALVRGLEGDYITLFLGDILKFDSNVDGLRGYTLYEYLRLNSDTRKMNTKKITTKEFKELFNIPKDGKGSYMRENGGFDRSNFERYVINPVLKMVARCDHVVLHNFGYDKKGEPILYRKVKKNGMIHGYEVIYTINTNSNPIAHETIIDSTAEAKAIAEPPKEAADQLEIAIKMLVDLMIEDEITSDQAKDIYTAANGDVEYIAKIYEESKNTPSIRNIYKWMKAMVVPGVYEFKPKKRSKKLKFDNFEGRPEDDQAKKYAEIEAAAQEKLVNPTTGRKYRRVEEVPTYEETTIDDFNEEDPVDLDELQKKMEEIKKKRVL